jgi:hypothetical protein
MSSIAAMIQTLSVILLSMASLSADFVCLNGHPTVAVEYRRRVVFIGTVVSEQYEPPTKQWDQEGTTYVVRVDERLRGQLPRTVQLFSENSSGRFPMEVGTKYLLFVYSDFGRTMVDNCGNSEVYSASSPKLRVVRRLKAGKKRN